MTLNNFNTLFKEFSKPMNSNPIEKIKSSDTTGFNFSFGPKKLNCNCSMA